MGLKTYLINLAPTPLVKIFAGPYVAGASIQAAIDTARTFGPVACERVVPIATADYPTPAARPANSVLDSSSIRETWGVGQPDWRRYVAETVEAHVSG